MDGGGLARAHDGRVVTAWRRDQQVVIATPGEREHIVGEGKDPALAVAGDVPVVAWQSAPGLVLRAGPGHPIALDSAGHTASLAALDDGSVIVAWQRGEESIATRMLIQSAASARSDSRSSGRVVIAN
jgi:hypothetical protein